VASISETLGTGSLLVHLGRGDEAHQALTDMIEFRPGISLSFVRKTLPITNSDYMDHLLDGLRKAGLSE